MHELCCLTHLLFSTIHVLVFSARAFSLWYCSSAITLSFCRRLFFSDGVFRRAPFTCRCFQNPCLVFVPRDPSINNPPICLLLAIYWHPANENIIISLSCILILSLSHHQGLFMWLLGVEKTAGLVQSHATHPQFFLTCNWSHHTVFSPWIT